MFLSNQAMNKIAHPISYDEFYETYLKQNKLCVFASTFTDDWPCRKDWVKEGCPNMEYINANFGHCTAPVADCNSEYFTSHVCADMLVSEYCSYWSKRDNKVLYLKDWHCQRDNRLGKNFYMVPMYFTSDWLNEYWDTKADYDDYRFVYIGVKGSWTPFHSDVFNSYSWSANICGIKKWLFYPPSEESVLRDKFGRLPFDLTANKNLAAQPIELIQNTGEIVFVPSGWHHQVFNLEDTISINHNWINACSLHKMLCFLKKELVAVKKEIDDCKTMDGFSDQCQLLLKANAGIDFDGLFLMISKLSKRRLTTLTAYLRHPTNVELLNKCFSSLYISSKPSITKHKNNLFDYEVEYKRVLFDLEQLLFVLSEMLLDEDFIQCKNFKSAKVLRGELYDQLTAVS